MNGRRGETKVTPLTQSLPEGIDVVTLTYPGILPLSSLTIPMRVEISVSVIDLKSFSLFPHLPGVYFRVEMLFQDE